MTPLSLPTLVDETLARARQATNGRAAHTLVGGHDRVLRQTLLALTAGTGLAEHGSPGEATLQVLRGRVRLRSGGDEWAGAAGDFLLIPPARHALDCDEDAVVVLTVAADGAA